MISKLSTFQIFPNLGPRGEGYQISVFSKLKKSPHHPRGGGQESYGIFSLLGTFLFFLGGGAAPLYFHQNFLYPSCTLSITVPLVIPMVPLCSLHLASLSPNTSSPQLAGSALPFS